MQTRMVKHCIGVLVLLICTALRPALAGGQPGVALQANIGEGATSVRHARQQASTAPTPVPEGFENLVLAPGALLHIEVYGVPEMSMELRVDAEGNVAIPLIGSLHVAGRTVAQAQNAIAKELSDREVFKDPQVTLDVLQFSAGSVSVTGEVQTPGRMQLLAPTPLGDVLAMAGGETNAAGHGIEVQHHASLGAPNSRHIDYAPGGDPGILHQTVVEPGDSVFVHKAGVVYVLGAVNRPGGYLMVNGGALNVVQAVSLAGGETPEHSTRWAIVVRKQGDNYEQVKVSLDKMEKGLEKPAPLQMNDALYVPASRWKSAIVSGSSILSAAAAASIYAVAANP